MDRILESLCDTISFAKTMHVCDSPAVAGIRPNVKNYGIQIHEANITQTFSHDILAPLPHSAQENRATCI